MKVLVLGADGMLGHMVMQYFDERNYEVRGTSRTDNSNYLLDITKNLADIEKILDEFKPEAIINCIGILNKVADKNQALAVLINSYLPHYVDELAKASGAKFVHISTDCVFDGKEKGGYTETSIRTATDFYGRSKGLGEIDNDHSVTLRTSIVGPDRNPNGVGLFQWFMKQTGEVDGYDKAIWTGVTTLELARCIDLAIINDLSGIRHVVNNEKIDKCSLINLFKKHFNKDITIHPKSDYAVDKSLVRTSDFDFEVPSYDQMVEEMADWITEHASMYDESQRVAK